jgi:hypothetical protein
VGKNTGGWGRISEKPRALDRVWSNFLFRKIQGFG